MRSFGENRNAMKNKAQELQEKIERALAKENEKAIETKAGRIIPRDPSINPADFAGMWEDRDDITVESLRRKAWGHDRR
jgi:hypothetical protein